MNGLIEMLKKFLNKTHGVVLAILAGLAYVVYLFTKNDKLQRELARKKTELEFKEVKDEINRAERRATDAVDKYRKLRNEYKRKRDSNRGSTDV